MSQDASTKPETSASMESAETVSAEGGLPDGPFDFDMEHAIISEEKRRHIVKLIGLGQSLDLRNLELFYQWMDDSYDALGFEPLWQQRFDISCRSFCGSTFTRVCLGVSVLKMAVGEIV